MKPALVIYRALLLLTLVLILALAGGTLWALFLRPAPAASRETGADAAGAEGPVFMDLGRLRLTTAGPDPATFIVALTFPYDQTDKAFVEELVSRQSDLKAIAADYFGVFTSRELRDRDEAGLRADLLARWNAALHLGSIQTLYFDDFMILD